MNTGPFDFYLQAWLVGLASGKECAVVRVSPSHRKCWSLVFIDGGTAA